MPSTTLILTLLTPVIIFVLWHLTATLTPPPPATLMNNKRIILLIAHPDDESMFFSPTLQALTNPSLQNHLKILCLSTGNADGLGETRRKELEKAAVTLGLRRREDVFVMDDPRFKDGMKESWDPNDIARVLASAFAPQLNPPSRPSSPPSGAKEFKSGKSENKSKPTSRSSKTSKPSPAPVSSPRSQPPQPEGPRATIDVLITFDANGISSHPNHIALYHGAKTFLNNIMKGHSGYACPVTLYTLPTINIARKYAFVLDAIPTYFQTVMDVASAKGGKEMKQGERVMFVNDVVKYWKAREAMTDGHKSQMVWFRWGWIGLGRYMFVNDLKRERIIAT